MYWQRSEGLAGWHQLDDVDIDVRGACGYPMNGFGDVFRGERLGSFVDVLSFLLVAFEANLRKFSSSSEARLDISDADRGA